MKDYMKTNKLELLAPAGDLEKLKIAILYGADAVYFGGKVGSLRAKAGNLSLEEIREGVNFAHSYGKKAFMTLNIYAHEEDLSVLGDYIRDLTKIDIDAFIVSDPGVIDLLKKIYLDAGKSSALTIHLSTQANTTNSASVNFWKNMGISRIVLARELTLDEIGQIAEKNPEMELEVFVHGAMCISYSGRCLLSNYMVGRDANRGECAHPCRWNYSLVEKKRPGEYLPIYEDERGTYIMNSKDLSMLGHLMDIMRAGACSIKLEGRMKSSYYVATVVRAYRFMLDLIYAGLSENSDEYKSKYKEIEGELIKASHREFITGFFYDKPTENSCDYGFNEYIREYSFVGLVLDFDEKTRLLKIEQRNKFSLGDEIEIFEPYGIFKMENNSKYFHKMLVSELFDEEMTPIESAPHAQQTLYMRVPKDVASQIPPFSMVRKVIVEDE